MLKTSASRPRLARKAVVGPWVDWKFPFGRGKKNIRRTHTTVETPMHLPNSDSIGKV